MDIPSILSELKIPFLTEGHHHCRTGWVQLDCPWCSPGTGRYRLGISIGRVRASCWVCGPVNLINTLKQASGKTRAAVAELAKGLAPDESAEPADERGTLRLPPDVGDMTPAHESYLRSRGFAPDEMRRLWGLQGIGAFGGRFAWRIFVPVVFHGETVSWTTRAIGTAGPRYLAAKPNQERIARHTLLYGEDYCRQTVIVCEGPADVWAVGPGAVALGGLVCTAPQLRRIACYPNRVVLLDNEPDAQRRAKALVCRLAEFAGTTYNVTLDAKDPGEASKSEIRKVRRAFLE